MHEPIRNHIEDYLSRTGRTTLPAEFTTHLTACAECREELAAIEDQAQLVRVLKPVQDPEPAPGFYARVLERIEAQRPASIWTIFLQPFGQRLAFASFALACIMGVYMYSTEPGFETSSAMTQSSIPDLGANQEQDRGAVLVSLVSYREQ